MDSSSFNFVKTGTISSLQDSSTLNTEVYTFPENFRLDVPASSSHLRVRHNGSEVGPDTFVAHATIIGHKLDWIATRPGVWLTESLLDFFEAFFAFVFLVLDHVSSVGPGGGQLNYFLFFCGIRALLTFVHHSKY